MFRSIQVFRIFGIPIKVHPTLVVFLPVLAMVMSGGSDLEAFAISLALMVLVFASVLLHELGHAVVAIAYGIKVPVITLTPIGGIARLGSMPREPKKELLITVAGPLVNVVLASIFLPLSLVFPAGNAGDLLGILWQANLALAIFNLLPGFPMDGGRILRAGMLLLTNMTYERATQIAVSVGQVTAFGLGILGLVLFRPMLIVIAIFIYIAAKTELIRVAHHNMMESVAQQMKAFGGAGFGGGAPGGFSGFGGTPSEEPQPRPEEYPTSEHPGVEPTGAAGPRDFVQRDGTVVPDDPTPRSGGATFRLFRGK